MKGQRGQRIPAMEAWGVRTTKGKEMTVCRHDVTNMETS